MNTKDINIGTQLKLGFMAILLFVIMLGVVSYLQSEKIHQQIEDMYMHPLKVRVAAGTLSVDILQMRLQMRGLPLVKNERETERILEKVDLFDADTRKQLDILYDGYLGPPSDIDSLSASIAHYKTIRTETIRLIHAGDMQEAALRLSPDGIAGQQVIRIFDRIRVIDDFAKKKGDTLFINSRKLKDSLTGQLIMLVVLILLLSLLINYIIIRNIRRPLVELTDTALRFHGGDMTARSAYVSGNEFGVLSNSFNTLAKSIEGNMNLNEKVVSLSALMLSKYEAKEFFREMLAALASHTASQMAAVYLLSDDKKTYQHFESMGMGNNARPSFSAGSFEGEFGAVLLSHKVEHIKNIPADTPFVFHTVSGSFSPREIITIPVLTNSEIVAVISLASVSKYSEEAFHLIESIFNTLRARVEGIIAYHKMRTFSDKLEQQNRELEAQTAEMAAQSAELTEQNAELEMQKSQLGEANQLKTNFLSNMSHELRTPLNSVIALSGVLNRRLAHKIPDEEYSYLEVIERNGKNLLMLINDILDISRIEAGHEEVENTRFNIAGLVTEVVSMLQPQAQQKHIGLVQNDQVPDLYLNSDMIKCRHILQNLLSNAVKFTEKGKVEITSGKNGAEVEIVVADTGIGISEAHQPFIFDEFRQADSSTSRRFGGTGLGLAIAKKYAILLGGNISVKSSFGQGSEFKLTLPLNFANGKVVVAEEVIPVKGYSVRQAFLQPVLPQGMKTILLVEDSEPAIIQIKDILEEKDFHVLVAHHGAEALGIIAHTIPDAMILDLMMPGIDGFEVLRTLRDAEPTAHIPVLILTAKHITKEELAFLKRNNVHQLIQKGDVNRGDLLRSVAAMVSSGITELSMPQREPQVIEGKPLLLVVEDNADNMLTVKALLSGTYTVIEAVDGHGAVEMAGRYQPDLILMDIALPGMNGIDAFKVIRGDAHLLKIPIIALTASAMTSDREAILAHGFDAYIAKPIDDNLFFKTINEVLYGE